MAQLAQGYLHLRPYDVGRRRLNEIGEAAEQAAVRAAYEIYSGDVTVDVRLEVGTLRTWITVTGVLTAYSVIADYKGFKESIGALCEDARVYAVDVCGAVKDLAGASERQVYRMERRLKTPGKINRLIERMEHLNEIADHLSAKEMNRQLEEIGREIEAIRRDLNEKEMAALNKVLRYENLPPIRQLPKPRHHVEMPRVATREEDDELMLFGAKHSIRRYLEASDEERLTFHKRTYVPRKQERTY
jgi:hypothetical protein